MFGKVLSCLVLAALIPMVSCGFRSSTEGPNVPKDGESAQRATEPKAPGVAQSPVGPAQPILPETQRGRETITNSIGMSLVFIAAGRFVMGSPSAERYRSADKQRHDVRIGEAFYLGAHEVTQAQWTEVMSTSPWGGQKYIREGPNYAATCVSWEDATKFCRKLTERERSAGRLGDGWEYSLPTEAQWEYACRAGTTGRYSFGDDNSRLGDYAWFSENARDVYESYAHGVGQKEPNPWGLYDVHGNVFEWCGDWYGEDYYGNSPAGDPRGPIEGSQRVIRGGSWFDEAWLCRSAHRLGRPPWYREVELGFRVARVPSRIARPAETIRTSIGMTLTRIPAGELVRDSRASESDGQMIRVSRAFYLGVHEVTQGQWRQVMGTRPWEGETYVREGVNYAATFVSWDDAMEFCRKLTLRERDAGRLPTDWEYTLPTEVQWEYACRAGTLSRYSFGDDGSRLGDYAWFGGIGADGTAANEQYAHEVGRKKPNPWGLYDMHGNVFEWCADWYGRDYFDSSPRNDPRGPAEGSYRVNRGGSWLNPAGYCGSSVRHYSPPPYRSSTLGFRVARVALD